MFVFKCLFACFQLQCIFLIVDKCDISMKNGKRKRKLFVHSFCSLSYYCQCFSDVVLCFVVVLLTSDVTRCLGKGALGWWATCNPDSGGYHKSSLDCTKIASISAVLAYLVFMVTSALQSFKKRLYICPPPPPPPVQSVWKPVVYTYK